MAIQPLEQVTSNKASTPSSKIILFAPNGEQYTFEHFSNLVVIDGGSALKFCDEFGVEIFSTLPCMVAGGL